MKYKETRLVYHTRVNRNGNASYLVVDLESKKLTSNASIFSSGEIFTCTKKDLYRLKDFYLTFGYKEVSSTMEL